MKTTTRQITWLTGISTGWGCGYVLIPEGHKLHGIHYDELALDVHGGLTYSELLTTERLKLFPEFSQDDVGGWVIGFDTAHYGDDAYNCPQSYVIAETERLKMQVENYNQ